ncbi:MAG: EAL domain-containing protein, partial [Deinococcota bacterium]|nr:EAL domain-containing protein [Deinococcota bacterium]
PATVIPIAEETGLIRALGAEVLRQACLQAKAWQARGLALRVAVNLSVKRLQRFDVIEDVRKALKESGLKAERLELELTEGAIIGAPDTLAALDALKTLGVYISVDDVGTAYASNYLKRLPIDGLKIDRFFVRNIGEDPEATPSDAAIIRSIIALGKSLNLTVVGEGVETVAQLRFLQALGCHEAQGYLFSKARPADEFEPLLKAGKVDLQDP